MGNSEKRINTHPQFNNLPPELRNHLNEFSNKGYITDDILPEIKISLLDAINNQKISSGYSPIYPKRIRYDINELIVWIGVNFSVYIKKEPDSIFEPEKTSKQICLVGFDGYERYDFIWENDIKDKIKKHKDIIDITIIKDYEKMLPLVINLKKTMQQKIGNLPKLGVENDQGDLVLLEKKIWRPDYSRIKDEQRISLKDCIYILLGIDDLSLMVSINGELDFITEEQSRFSWKDDFYILPFVHADNSFRDVIVTAKYREGWHDVISFIREFVFEIIREANVDNIKWFDHSTLTGYTSFSLHDINQETHKCYFETLPFLKWAKGSDYAIPEELSFIENADGALKWVDSNIGIDELRQSKKKNIIKDVEDKINSFLKKIRPEIDMFYESLKLHARHDGRGTLEISYDDACEVFKKKNAIFKTIKLEDIHKSFFGSEKPWREIKGGLIRHLIIQALPEAKSHTSDIKLSAQDLYQRSNSLKTS